MSSSPKTSKKKTSLLYGFQLIIICLGLGFLIGYFIYDMTKKTTDEIEDKVEDLQEDLDKTQQELEAEKQRNDQQDQEDNVPAYPIVISTGRGAKWIPYGYYRGPIRGPRWRRRRRRRRWRP